jgi:3-methyladenine DNA glycosylase Tag
MPIPEQIDAATLADYFAVMSRAIFQAGLSWALIESKWPAYERLFGGFDPVVVAALDDFDIDRIAEDPGIVRTRKKVAATVENARTMLALDREHGGFAAYLRSFGSYEALSTDLKARFTFLGEHPRMREMVALARGEPIPEPPPRGFSRRRRT